MKEVISGGWGEGSMNCICYKKNFCKEGFAIATVTSEGNIFIIVSAV